MDNKRADNLGIAFDLGTTTLVGYFMSLASGEIMDTVSIPNPQIKYGMDVVSRITFMAESGKNRKLLSDTLGDAAEEMAEGFIKKASLAGDVSLIIQKVVLVGNPVIMGSIADHPFSKIKEFNPDVNIIRVPSIGHYVGADALSAAFMCEIKRGHKNVLMVDVGTNTEIVLLTDKEKIATSAAAGPALEGMNISSGMTGREGAIDFVKLTKTVNADTDIIFHVIGEVTPVGICGSGLLSLTECMLESGIIDNDGYLLSKHEALEQNVPFKIASRIGEDKSAGNENGTTTYCRYFRLTDKIKLTQEDIRNLQLAKSAIRSGIEILISKINLTESVIDKVYLAGAFGNKITIDSTLRCGMLPEAFRDKIVQSGNLAGLGACKILSDDSIITDVFKLKNEVLTVSLANEDEFQSVFMEHMKF